MKRGSLSKSKKKSKQWTILCVGESGNISSIKLSKNSLIIIGSFVGISFLFAIAALIAYATIKADNLQLQSCLKAVETELNSTTEEKENLMAQLLIAQEDLYSKQNVSKPSKKEIEPEKPVRKPLKPALAKEAETAAQTIPPALQTSSTIAQTIPDDDQTTPAVNTIVENFELHKNPKTKRVRYEFFLKNKEPGKKAVSGYTFVLLKPDKGDPTSWRVSPQGTLHEGRPTNFKRGQLFSIVRFKIVRGYIKNTESIDYWEEAVVLVYSYSGELILEKVFDYAKQKPKVDTSQQADRPVQTDISISTQVPQDTETAD